MNNMVMSLTISNDRMQKIKTSPTITGSTGPTLTESETKTIITRPSALGMSDPVMEFLEFPEKGKIFWGRRERF